VTTIIDEYRDMAEDARRRIASEGLPKICATCGAPATCFGRYEDMVLPAFACDGCCQHGNETGRCVFADEALSYYARPLATAVLDLACAHDLLAQALGVLGPATSIRGIPTDIAICIIAKTAPPGPIHEGSVDPPPPPLLSPQERVALVDVVHERDHHAQRVAELLTKGTADRMRVRALAALLGTVRCQACSWEGDGAAVLVTDEGKARCPICEGDFSGPPRPLLPMAFEVEGATLTRPGEKKPLVAFETVEACVQRPDLGIFAFNTEAPIFADARKLALSFEFLELRFVHEGHHYIADVRVAQAAIGTEDVEMTLRGEVRGHRLLVTPEMVQEWREQGLGGA